MSSLLNQKACKEYILELAKASRPRFTRISKEYMRAIESQLKISISKSIQNHPSVGKTITEFNYY